MTTFRLLLTAVRDGGTGAGEEFPDESLLLPTKHSSSVTLDSSGTLATTGPAMIIRSVIRIRH